MLIFKCKMCGGSLSIEEDKSVATCNYCGTKQTLPKLNDDRRANLYDRANHFRRNNEFDKAMGIYEQILAEDNTDAEAYWSRVLSRYGIEYVEDPATKKRVHTVNRAQYTSIFDDADYKAALKYADTYQRKIYEEEARTINEIQKGILAISQEEDPFDVFICYKETDNQGRRTPDSVLANDLYHQLTREGFKVFFSRLTLEDKLGTAYEPYIFAALNSAKVMVVIGTKAEYFNAVWVKNEWSRFLTLIKDGSDKTLIPAYRDMDPYDLPEEFSHLQAQDMSKLGFMQDLIRGIKKITATEHKKITVPEPIVSYTNVQAEPLLKRSFMFIEDGEFNKADDFFEQVLNLEPEMAMAYVGKLMVELKIKHQDELANHAEPFDDNNNYKRALRYADGNLKATLLGYNEVIKERNETSRLDGIYNDAKFKMDSASTEEQYKYIAEIFTSISSWRDSETMANACLAKAEEARKDAIYNNANIAMKSSHEKELLEAIELFESIPNWRDSGAKISECRKKLFAIKQKAEADRIAAEKAKRKNKIIASIVIPIITVIIAFVIMLPTLIIPNKNRKAAYLNANILLNEKKYDAAINIYSELEGYKDSDELIKEANYLKATGLLSEAKYNDAVIIFYDLGDYSDSAEKFKEANYRIALSMAEDESIDVKCGAIDIFEVLEDYLDSKKHLELLKNNVYESATSLYKKGNFDEATTLFEKLGTYKDSADILREVNEVNIALEEDYIAVQVLLDNEDYVGAVDALASLGNYKDSAKIKRSVERVIATTESYFESMNNALSDWKGYRTTESELRKVLPGEWIMHNVDGYVSNLTLHSDGTGHRVGQFSDVEFPIVWKVQDDSIQFGNDTNMKTYKVRRLEFSRREGEEFDYYVFYHGEKLSISLHRQTK